MISRILPILLSISLAVTVFSKNYISYGMALCLLLSIVIIYQSREAIFSKKNLLSFFKTKEIVAIGILLLVWLLSSIFANNVSLALKEWGQICGTILGGFLIYIALRQIRPDMKAIFSVASAAAAIFSFILLLEPWSQGLWDLGITRYYGSVLVIIIPMAWMLFIQTNTQSKLNLFLWALVIFLLTSAVFATGGRTAWLTLIGMGALFPFLVYRKNIARPVLKSLIVLTISVSSVFFGLLSYQNNFGEAEYTSRINAMTSTRRPASGRLEAWQNMIPHIQDNIWWGLGIKGVKDINISNGNVDVAHAHNALIELLIETGLFGLLAFLMVITIFVYSFLNAYIRNSSKDEKQAGITVFLACIAYGVGSMAVTSLFHTWWFLYLIVLLILLKTAETNLRQQQNPCIPPEKNVI